MSRAFERPRKIVRKEPSRMANSGTFQGRLGEALRPWSSYERKDYDPAYYGVNEAQYVAKGKDHRRQIDAAKSDGVSRKHIMNELQRQLGIDYREAKQTLEDIDRGRYRGTLRPFTKGVPHAAADEQLSRFILQESGFDNARLMNEGNYFATDLVADYEGTPLKIDAQQRMGRHGGLNLGILNSIPQGGERILNEAPGSTKLIDLIRNLRDYGAKRDNYLYSREDKLLQHDNVLGKLNPSSWVDKMYGDVEKDAIISNLRGKHQAPNSPFGRNVGPYNPTVPEGVGYIDLHNLRDRVLDLSLDQLQSEAGMKANYYPGDKGKLSLQIPKRVVDMLTVESKKVDPTIIQQMSQQSQRPAF